VFFFIILFLYHPTIEYIIRDIININKKGLFNINEDKYNKEV